MRNNQKEASYLKKKKDEISIRSSAAEYLTYVASIGDQQDSIEMRYEDEKKLCDMIAKSLHQSGYEVDVCNDGEEALDMIYAEMYEIGRASCRERV